MHKTSRFGSSRNVPWRGRRARASAGAVVIVMAMAMAMAMGMAIVSPLAALDPPVLPPLLAAGAATVIDAIAAPPPPATKHLVWPSGRADGWLACLLVQLSARRLLPSAGPGRPSQYRGCLFLYQPTRPTRRVGYGLASHVQQSRQQDDIPKGRALPWSASAQVSWLVGDPSIHTCKVCCRCLAARPRLLLQSYPATHLGMELPTV